MESRTETDELTHSHVSMTFRGNSKIGGFWGKHGKTVTLPDLVTLLDLGGLMQGTKEDARRTRLVGASLISLYNSSHSCHLLIILMVFQNSSLLSCSASLKVMFASMDAFSVASDSTISPSSFSYLR